MTYFAMAHWERRAQCLDFLDWALIAPARARLVAHDGAGRRTFRGGQADLADGLGPGRQVSSGGLQGSTEDL